MLGRHAQLLGSAVGIAQEELRRLRAIGANAANALGREALLEGVRVAGGEPRFQVRGEVRVVTGHRELQSIGEQLPLGVRHHHQEHPAVAAAIQALQRPKAVAFRIHRRAFGLAGIGQKVVPVGVGVGAEHVDVDLLPVAAGAARGKAQQGGGGHHHGRVGVRIHLVGAQQLAGGFAQAFGVQRRIRRRQAAQLPHHAA